MHHDDRQSYSPNTIPRDLPGPNKPHTPQRSPLPLSFKRIPNFKWWLLCGGLALAVVLVGVLTWAITHHHAPASDQNVITTDTGTGGNSSVVQAPGLQLDPSKNYGDKYANGVLPVGDGKYNTTASKQGTVYACSAYAKSLMNDQGGAQTRGPWFVDNNTQYDSNKKSHVQGSVLWKAAFSNRVDGGTRTIVSNNLPAHPTGLFPIAASDPVYAYDRNPNSISGQTFTYSLDASPGYGSPSCMGGEVGVMLTGVALFNAFDAGGRDAGAWEVQDSCSGHPQKDGVYHYHTLSSCIKDTSVRTVIGYALDGFPITGPRVGNKNYLTTSDLDECHGITSQVNVDGKSTTTYHYVMTQDFPYSVSCFRATAIQAPDLQQHPPQKQQ